MNHLEIIEEISGQQKYLHPGKPFAETLSLAHGERAELLDLFELPEFVYEAGWVETVAVLEDLKRVKVREYLVRCCYLTVSSVMTFAIWWITPVPFFKW